MKTADLCDRYAEELQIAEPGLLDFGGHKTFSGVIVTLKIFEDNSLVREELGNSGENKVLVVDGGGSLSCALLGDNLATLAVDNYWSGIVINGCVRDSAELGALQLGIRALNTHPLKSIKLGIGERQVSVRFSGITFRPGDYLYADQDGIVVATQSLH
jgi:regulator of ribonuclease activity A